MNDPLQPTEIIAPNTHPISRPANAVVESRWANPAPEDGRQHTAPGAARTRTSTTRLQVSGRRRPFGASILIASAAQAVLAAATAAQQISPIVAATAAAGLLVCGLGLILAEIVQVSGR